MKNRRLPPLVLVVPLMLAGCFDTPVRERMEIAFERDGTAVVRVEVEVADEGATPEMNERLEAIRAELIDGRDSWSRRFARVNPKYESFGWEKSQGKVRQATRAVRINPDDLGNIFYDTALQLRYHEDRGYAEFTIYAGRSQRATRDQVREFGDAADRWAHALTRYYRALDELYRYAESYPDRAEGMFAIAFADDREGDGGPKDDGSGEPQDDGAADPVAPQDDSALPLPVTEEERSIAEGVIVAMEDVLDAQGRAEGRDISADELARLVNDPFPADLLVRTNGEIEEVEGFVLDGEPGAVRVERRGLLEAFSTMRGRWASPDPFLEIVEQSRRGDEAPPMDLQAFLSQPRVSSPPADWREVRKALDESLSPASTYRVRWRLRR